MAKMTIGAQLYTVRRSCKTLADIVQSLAKVKAIGYSAVQLSGHGPVAQADLVKALKDAGLAVAATHIDWQRFRDQTDAVIDEHRQLGCRHPAIGGLPDEYYESADGVKRFIDELAPVAKKLAAAGMDFSYHNHSRELVRLGKSNWLTMLYEQAPANMLKAELDVYWLQHGGADPAAWVRKCAGREPLLHAKDMIVCPDHTQRFAEVGEGNLNWPAIIEAAAAGGVEYVLVEQDNCYDRDPFDSLAISFRNLSAAIP